MIKYKLNDKILLRQEYFGGILIDSTNFQRVEITRNETIFLLALEEMGGNLYAAKKIVENIDNKDFNYSNLIKLGAIKPMNNKHIKTSLSEESVMANIQMNLKKIENMNVKHLSAPLEITIYPTLKCNLNCKFCFVKNKNISHQELDYHIWSTFLKEAASMGVLSVSILGGEPTKYNQIDLLLEELNNINIKTTITSNGIDINKSTLEKIINSKKIIPIFSIQAFNEKNKELMGIEYERTLETVEYLLEKNKEVRLNSVYTNQSIEELIEIIDYCIKNGIKRYSIGTYVDINNQNNNIKKKTFFDIRRMDEQLQSYVKTNYKNYDFDCVVEGCMLFSAYPEMENDIWNISEFEKQYYGCRAGKSKIEIYPNGDVYPCICFENELCPTSNICNESLIDIWYKDPTINLLRSKKTENQECLQCGYNVICNSGCPAMKSKEFGHLSYISKDTRCLLHELK